MRIGGSSQDEITVPVSHDSPSDVVCEQSTLPTVHDSEDDFIDDNENSNVEGDRLEEHCSHSTDAVTTSVEIDSDLHQDAVNAPSVGNDSDHQDVSSANVQQTQHVIPEEHDHGDGDSLQLEKVTSVPPIGSADGITHSDAGLHHYPRRSHRPPQCYADYVLH